VNRQDRSHIKGLRQRDTTFMVLSLAFFGRHQSCQCIAVVINHWSST